MEPEEADFRGPRGTSLMEAQESGEMMASMDEAMFALDGLKLRQPIRVQRSAATSLASICSAVDRRRLLRSQGLIKQIMDALLLLPITDHPLALAAAAIFFFVSSDDVESDFPDPSHALSFLLALLEHHSAPAPPPASPSPRPAPASAASRGKSPPARASFPWRDCPVKGGERREAEAAAAAESLVLATLKRICSSVIALQAPDNTLPPFSSSGPGRHQLMRVGLKDEMRRLGGLHLLAAVAARHMLQFPSLSSATLEPRAGGLGAKEADREAWGDAKRRRLGSKEHPFGFEKKHHLQQKHKRMGGTAAAAAASEGLTHKGRISTGVDVATSCLGVLEHVTFMSRDNQDYLIRLSLPTDTLPGAKRRKLSACHTASPAAAPLMAAAASSRALEEGKGASSSERPFLALLLECLEGLAEEAEDEEKEGEVEENGKEGGLRNFKAYSGAGAVVLGEAVEEEQESSDDGSEESGLSGRERHRRASGAVEGGSGVRESGDGGLGMGEGVGKDPYEFLMDSQVEELLVGEELMMGEEWGGMRGGEGCGEERGGVCGSGIRLGEEVEGESSGGGDEGGGLCRQGKKVGHGREQNGRDGDGDGEGGGTCKERLSVRSRAGRRFVLAACKVLMNVTNHSAEGCRAVAGAHGIAVVASLAAACFSDRCWQHALASAGEQTEKEGVVSREGGRWEGDSDVLVVLLGLIVNLVEADSDARSLLAAATCTRQKQSRLRSKQHKRRGYTTHQQRLHATSTTSSGRRGEEEAGREEESVSMVSLLDAERTAVAGGSGGAEEMGMAEQRRQAEREVEELQRSVLGQGDMVLQGETMGEGVGTGKEMGEEMGSGEMVMSMMVEGAVEAEQLIMESHAALVLGLLAQHRCVCACGVMLVCAIIM
ncbi:unnamed protein product [Closterium sp. Yama58-4]|nr:unnamed protein product [Closterium sp. Yama58-4]